MQPISTEQSASRTAIKTFILFSNDTIDYTLDKNGTGFWEDFNNLEDFISIPSRFDSTFGDAVLCCRDRHKGKFNDLILNYPYSVFSDIYSLTMFMKFAIPKVMKDDVFLMDMLRLFAFFADLAIKCHTSGAEYLIRTVVENTELIYFPMVRKAFQTVGGYHSLTRLAKQYLEYQNSMFKEVKIFKFGNAYDLDFPAPRKRDTNFEKYEKLLSNDDSENGDSSTTLENCAKRPTIVLNRKRKCS